MLPRQRKSVSLEVMTLATSMDRMAELLDEKIRAIETQRNQLDTVFSSMIESVIAIDLEERILSLNAAAARLLGIDREKAQGRYVQSVIRNPDLQRQIGKVLSTGEPVEEEIVLQDEEGKKLLQTRIVILSDGKSRSVGALVVMHDETSLRRLETIRRDFVANVSHELRTPITSIRGYVETLLDGALDNREDSINFLQIVLRQSDRLNAIIDDLLALSRIEKESREGEIALQEGPLYPVLAAALQTCQVEADKAAVKLVLECPESLLADMNDTLLEQAVVNLLVNAIKYSRQGDTVTLRAFAAGDPSAKKAVISVRDTGCGIAKEHLPRLFERFYRSDRARSRAVGGTGLGLAIVKHIVQAHAGTIEVQSREGVGSEFRITLTGRLA
jgi:two-component system phosphate regulon sensor histidine kinase PhoR